MEITSPENLVPLVKKFKLENGITLYKLSKGFEILDVIEPELAKDVLYFILKKKEDDFTTYRLLRYKKNIHDVSIDAEFKATTTDSAVLNTLGALSKHLF
ncbi:hypothetical protein [Hydrogenivirga sp. 128-5-R1-1]|uniref:hypothetical protein n=1 Tax=Hydrogenivirga sp. 128-5-R1-1 TaxID=392423 RepID=UPI00015EF9CD|nr:hypothetical protein [Hydrogenivirga sp. 128-5-R1-1]EDP73364.1 hypothetical protein HG1285_09826 [Hydrogenivirga sp. 128-5-R1-1]